MKKMTLMQHFTELRRRILWMFGVFCLAVLFGWYVAPIVQEFIATPLLNIWDGGQLLYTGLSDGVMIRFSLSVTVALLIVMPVLLWNIWAFIEPGLKKSERGFIWPILILSPILFILGCAFAFYVLFPFVFSFFLEINQATTVPTVLLPAARDYLSLVLGMLKVFGIAFQLPLVLVMLNRIGILSREQVIKMRRYVIVLIVVVAAILTPPDVVSQILLALPMWALFELSILFMRE